MAAKLEPVIELGSVVVRSTEPVEAEVDGSIVMMSLEQGQYYGLDSVGSRVWQLLATGAVVSDLCAELSREFDVDTATCQRDVVEFLKALAAAGLIEVRNGTAD